MIRLEVKYVAKPWGRRDVGDVLDGVPATEQPIGEIWFEAPFPVPLLVKFLFTSEPLSIQVHPDDAAARAMGLAHGKDEAWIILEAEPEAVIGLGLKHELSREQLREAALDGSIETLIDWRRVQAGQAIYSPGGTVHALGAGLKLVEIQQNLDLTFRLYDFGRPRPLQLEEAVDVAIRSPYEALPIDEPVANGRTVVAGGPAFRVERWSGPASFDLDERWPRPIWLVPLSGDVRVADEAVRFGEVWLLDRATDVCLGSDGVALAAFTTPS